MASCARAQTLMTPLAQGAVLPPHTIAKIFSCCDRISELSDTMSEQLRMRLEEWDVLSSTVSDVFKVHSSRACPVPTCKHMACAHV